MTIFKKCMSNIIKDLQDLQANGRLLRCSIKNYLKAQNLSRQPEWIIIDQEPKLALDTVCKL